MKRRDKKIRISFGGLMDRLICTKSVDSKSTFKSWELVNSFGTTYLDIVISVPVKEK